MRIRRMLLTRYRLRNHENLSTYETSLKAGQRARSWCGAALCPDGAEARSIPAHGAAVLPRPWDADEQLIQPA